MAFFGIKSFKNKHLLFRPKVGPLLDISLKPAPGGRGRHNHGRTADEAYYGDHQTLQAR
jgi:hypothetical protein